MGNGRREERKGGWGKGIGYIYIKQISKSEDITSHTKHNRIQQDSHGLTMKI